MKRIRQVLWICLFTIAVFGIRGWAIQRQATPLAKQFALEMDAFEAEYGKGGLANGDDRVLLRCDLGQEGERFLVAGAGYEDWILLDLLIKDEEVADVRLVYSIESDGYGSYVEEEWFLSRVMLSVTSDLELVKYRKEAENEVVAITGATETSQGVVDAVNACITIR